MGPHGWCWLGATEQGGLLENTANPKGFLPSGFAKAELRGKGEFIPVGDNVIGVVWGNGDVKGGKTGQE